MIPSFLFYKSNKTIRERKNLSPQKKYKKHDRGNIMTHPPRITDESVLMRWMSMEIGRINEGVVKDRKSLSILLMEETPCAPTKKGNLYFFL